MTRTATVTTIIVKLLPAAVICGCEALFGALFLCARGVISVRGGERASSQRAAEQFVRRQDRHPDSAQPDERIEGVHDVFKAEEADRVERDQASEHDERAVARLAEPCGDAAETGAARRVFGACAAKG